MQNVNGTTDPSKQENMKLTINIISFPFKRTLLLQSGLCKQDASLTMMFLLTGYKDFLTGTTKKNPQCFPSLRGELLINKLFFFHLATANRTILSDQREARQKSFTTNVKARGNIQICKRQQIILPIHCSAL